ncbi:MAG: succinate dehydrogenase/fumarate reductase iron-sulfur subunit [Candidatus Helarchaeota archaeon]
MSKEKVFLVYRKDADEKEPHYERFAVPLSPGMTILDALFYIQDHLDSTLSFRYACRGAICGSCGMTINKYPRLACNLQVQSANEAIPSRIPEIVFGDIPDWNEESEILIEPLPNMDVIKDLIVDMNPFWDFYREVKPFLTRQWRDEGQESRQSAEDVKVFEHLIYCILCGLCWTCPVSGKKRNYLGPAALAKGFRFIADTRSTKEHKDIILERIARKDAVPACERIFACNIVCPKGVMPGSAIHSEREILHKKNEK